MSGAGDILLGALLHDIGKFMQRAHPPGAPLPEAVERLRHHVCPTDPLTQRSTREHALWTQAFFHQVRIPWPREVNAEVVARLARSHHKPSAADEYVISRADALSAGLDRAPHVESERPDFRAVRLNSVFETLDGPQADYRHAHALLPLTDDLQVAFPCPLDALSPPAGSDLTGEYARLWQGFAAEAATIQVERYDAFLAALLDLLHRYTWCIPASTQDLPDVSLYDHLKTTAALAACIYLVCARTGELDEAVVRDGAVPRFLLLSGELGGIQRYLYEIAEVGVGGTAKRLRARSFHLSMLAEVAAARVLEEFGLTRVNLLMSSGGHFYLLLPNLPDAPQRLAGLRAEMEEWLHAHLLAQVRLDLAWKGACDKDFLEGRFADLMAGLAVQIQESRRRPLAAVLQAGGQWQEAAFIPTAAPPGQTWRPCRHCGKLPAADPAGETPCRFCAADAQAGRQLAQPQPQVAVFREPRAGGAAALGRWLQVNPAAEDIEVADWVIAINPAAGLRRPRHRPLWVRYLANAVPRAGDHGCQDCQRFADCCEEERPDAGGPLLFSCLAQLAQGRQALGFLRGDVDHLGEKFALGFRGQLCSISRLATMSRMLDLFFGSYVDQVIRREEDFRHTYTVYSGGDDFFLVGPWDRTLHLAAHLRQRFADFTCGRLSFSAGFLLTRAGTPVAIAARQAGDHLQAAKRAGRDRLCAFGTTLRWADVPDALRQADQVAQWLREEVIGAAAARRLLVYEGMWRRFHERGETAALRFVPLLAYDLARNWPAPDDKDPTRAAARRWANAFLDLNNSHFHHLRFVLEYALNAHRGRET